jgi:hypothetical protein
VSDNWAIELHDSTIANIAKDDSAVIVQFRPAYVHRSAGVPGVDAGTGWLQDVDLILSEARISEQPSGLGDISDGSLSDPSVVHENCVPLPSQLSGGVKFEVVLAPTGERLRIEGRSASIQAVGEPRYLEQFA